MSGDFTVNKLTFLNKTFCQALGANKEIWVVFCEISKAFDRVWHAGLLRKLEAACVTGKLFNWFKNTLFERRQRVFLVSILIGQKYFLVFHNGIYWTHCFFCIL